MTLCFIYNLSIEITNGCTYEVLSATILEEETRGEVVVEIAEVLEAMGIPNITSSLFGGIPEDSGDTDSGNATSTNSQLRKVYASLATTFEEETSEKGYTIFTEAVSQITEAKVSACEDGSNLSKENFPALVSEYGVLKMDFVKNVGPLRDIFGKTMCLNEKEHLEQNQNSHCPEREDCTCPESGHFDCVCEFFACLDPEDDIKPLMGFLGIYVPEGSPCLAFTVDTTGSMGTEISTVKEVIRAFLSSEEHGPGCYVLQQFNDNARGYFDPTSM